MDAITENRERLKKLGISVDEHGNFSKEGDPAPLAGAQDVETDPDAGSTDSEEIAAPATPQATPATTASPAAPLQTDDLETRTKRATDREEAAKAEQRKLSGLQLNLQRKLEELDAKLAVLDKTAPATPAPLNVDELPDSVKALMSASPELAQAVLDLTTHQTNRTIAPILSVQKQFEEQTARSAKTELDTRFERVTAEVKAAHADADTITNSAEFQDWLLQQPNFVRKAGIAAIYDDTANADAKDIVQILNLYPGGKAPAAPRHAPPVAPNIAPANLGGTRTSSKSLGPLSENEMAAFGSMKNDVAHDPVALSALMRRLEQTLNPQ